MEKDMKRMMETAGRPAWSLLCIALLLAAAPVKGSELDFSSQAARVADGVVVAGLVDLDKLRASHTGDVLVVDLRTEGEGAPEEAEAAKALGLGYRNIPVSSAQVDPDQVANLRGLLEEAGPDTLVVVHCVSGNRAGMLWGAAALAGGRSIDSIHASLEGVLTKQPTIDGLEAYARTLDAEH